MAPERAQRDHPKSGLILLLLAGLVTSLHSVRPSHAPPRGHASQVDGGGGGDDDEEEELLESLLLPLPPLLLLPLTAFLLFKNCAVPQSSGVSPFLRHKDSPRFPFVL